MPYKFNSAKNLRIEHKKTILASQDHFFASYVNPASLKLGGALKSCQLFAPTAEEIQKLRSSILQRSEEQTPSLPFYKTFSDNFIAFLGQFGSTFVEKLMATNIPVSSIHGDLHIENIFSKDNETKIIDWRNYSQEFWNSYDCVHFELMGYIYNSNVNSWFQAVQEFHGERLLTKNSRVLYAVSRCFFEYDADVVLGRLTSKRKEKYAEILRWCEHNGL
ncbi:MAG: hypothetical protein HON43_06995 [Alphaproteobacteria bacterium]|nr:hypothetical protein [Alphaproteobacteria bacterium]MBT5389777.1 hypothetical protein [Alphaproteobacteria bacterium]MBT5540803.1 hypothetical protein [Alphaproteobacteria bacterium]